VNCCDSIVFLSYHSAHKQCAARLNEYLTADGVEVWADWERIGRRSDWRTEVARCLPDVDLLVAVGGSDYFSSPNCSFEWEYALQVGVHRVRLEDAHPDLPKSGFFGKDPTKPANRSVGRAARSLALFTSLTDHATRCCSNPDA
jgi:hypothetical protein